MKKSNPILNGFKGSKTQEISKCVLNPHKLDNSKYDIFSDGQIKEYLKSVIAKNEGMALEIQKSVVANVKSEISNLVPVNIMHNGVSKRFYVAKTGACVELAKAMEPVNKKEGYFDNIINEDEVLKFIDENQSVDDEILLEKFGEGINDILNSLEEEGKIDVDEDGYYFVTDGIEENEEEEEEGNENNDEEDKEVKEVEDEEKEEEIDDKKSTLGEEISLEEEAPSNDIEKNNEEEEKLEEEEEEKIESEEDEQFSGALKGQDEEEKLFNENEEGLNANNTEEEESEEFDNEEEEKVEVDNDLATGKEKGDMTPEELEEFAKKTATVTLLKFYKNSTDEKLKEIAAIELKSRGVDIENSGDGGKVENSDLPENKAALEALEKFTKDHLGQYDNEDLISVVVELANQDPGKRKELKDLYRSFYSSTNSGNKLLKVDENEFKTFLTDHYFNNFTPGDLQSYAYLLISKNPKEYRKYKKMMDLQNEPII